MPITNEVLDEILKDYEKPEDLLSENGLLQQLTKALVERALNGEMTHHPGYEKNSPAGNNSGNSRNGTTPKTIKGKRGQMEIEVPPEPECRVRAAARQKESEAFRRFGREDYFSLCQRNDDQRDSGSFRRDLRRRCFAVAHIERHRCRP